MKLLSLSALNQIIVEQ